MYLLKEKIISHDTDKEELQQVKRSFGIRRIPDYFLSLLYAVQKMELSEEEKEGLGIIYASHLGPIGQVHKYIDDLLTYPPEECSPAFFSHSVFNAPVAFLTKYLNIQGSSLSVCGFQQIIESSVLSAFAWLKTSYCKNVLIIYSDDISGISCKISDLTGLQLFASDHLLLLTGEAMGESCRKLSAEEIIEKIKKQQQNGGF